MSVTGGTFAGASNAYKKLQIDQELILNGKLTMKDDWKTYTPTMTNLTLAAAATRRSKFRVVGRTLHVSMEFLQTSPGVHVDGAYTFALPTGCLAIAPLGARTVGTAYVIGVDSGTTLAFVGNVLLLTASTVYVQYMAGPTTTVNSITWGFSASNAASLRASAGTSLNFSLDFQVELDPASPILAASSNQ